MKSFRAKSNYFQQSTYTTVNRYPLLFRLCKQYFEENKNSIQPQKIISFGCSTGEEVITLNRLFPNAKVVGVDINHWCIKECRQKYGHYPNITFFHSQSIDFQQQSNFDAIFCLAVLQYTKNRTQAIDQPATAFTFQQFEEIIKKLNSKLNNKGLLVIDHTDFSFLDTTISKAYDIYPVAYNNANQELKNIDNQQVMYFVFN